MKSWLMQRDVTAFFFVQLESAIASQKVQKQNGTQLEHFCDDAKMF